MARACSDDLRAVASGERDWARICWSCSAVTALMVLIGWC